MRRNAVLDVNAFGAEHGEAGAAVPISDTVQIFEMPVRGGRRGLVGVLKLIAEAAAPAAHDEPNEAQVGRRFSVHTGGLLVLERANAGPLDDRQRALICLKRDVSRWSGLRVRRRINPLL